MKQTLFLLYTIIILRYPIYSKDWQTHQIYEDYEKDNEFLELLSKQISSKCKSIPEKIVFSGNLQHSFNSLFGVKSIHFGNYKISSSQNVPVVIKYFGNDKTHDLILEILKTSNTNKTQQIIKKLKKEFFENSQLAGTKFCPKSQMDRFLNRTTNNQSKLLKLLYLNFNIQLLLLPILNSENQKQFENNKTRKFKVPKVYEICGNTMYQSYDGHLLLNYFNSSFHLKLQIVKQLITGMIEFTEGIDGFHIYFTDFNADNIVFNDKTKEISFIDLDNVIIVDSIKKSKKKFHTHEYIECPGCFAYVPRDICSSHLSDLNYFVVCQFLRENLHKDRSRGFLQPISSKYKNLMQLIDLCIDCPSTNKCSDRFVAIKNLLNEINRILN